MPQTKMRTPGFRSSRVAGRRRPVAETKVMSIEVVSNFSSNGRSPRLEPLGSMRRFTRSQVSLPTVFDSRPITVAGRLTNSSAHSLGEIQQPKTIAKNAIAAVLVSAFTRSRAVRCSPSRLAYFPGNFGFSEALGVTSLIFGVTSAFTSPSAHLTPPIRMSWKIGLVHTSSRWPMEV